MRKWEPRLSLSKLLNDGGLMANSWAVNCIEEAMQLDHRDKWNFDGFWISQSNRTKGYSIWLLAFKSASFADLSFGILIKPGANQGSSLEGNNIVPTEFKKMNDELGEL